MARSYFNPDNHAKNLPDVYDKRIPDENDIKNTGSNNFKILEIERIACNDLRQSLSELDNILDLDKARNKTLDMYGKKVGQPRGMATDEQYLLMIKARIVRNLMSGSYPSIVNAICYTFDCEPSEVLIIDRDEMCTVELLAIPFRVITTAGLTAEQTIAIIKSMLPVGITFETFSFAGTFEFGESELDNVDGDKKGFSIEYTDDEKAIGGTLGATYGESEELILPI